MAPELITRSKDVCPHHGRDSLGRPVPPVGFCGPLCWMRPHRLEDEQVPVASSA